MSTFASSSAVLSRSIFFWRNSGELTPKPASMQSPHRPSYPSGSARRPVASRYTRRRFPLLCDRVRGQLAGFPVLPQQPQDRHVAALAGMDVPADEDAFSDEAHALERAERAIVAGVRVRADPLQPQTPESEREDQRLRLRVGPAAPIRPAEPRPDYGSPVASG